MLRKQLFLFGLIVISCQWIAPSRGELSDEFRHPPESARPWTYWFIMDGNVSREGITADLEAMAKAGLGGVILMEVDVGIPRGPVEFMSEEWRELFKHAVEEAERLGLQITLNAGPGWTGSGGPWVDVEQSMQHLVASATEVDGPKMFQAALPVPEPRPPYFGESGLPPEILEARKNFYSDVAVLTIPRIDGYRIADIDEKALYVRAPYTSKPGVKPFLPAPAEYPNLPVQSVISATAILDLTDHLQPDGRLNWEVPKGEWTLLRFGRRTTGANTRPAPRPGLGFESDKFDKAALDSHFENFVGKLLEAVGPRPVDRENGWTMLHIDSWEMGSQNWTDGFGAEFRKRRGYDPTPYLPALTGRVVDNLEISERFLWDLRLTAQELVIENHAQHLKELGRRHGFGLSIEPYDMNPTADLTLGGVADVPMCEFWSDGYGFDSAFTCFESTSIAHTLGKPIVAAEAFTAGSGEAWKLYPGAMKNQGDWA
ncbi:MAG: glycosyl hydrolase, partial [Candidatus Omnitrophica bacterium]|nr:glycosyl hydrolase [Candidatus Omnitrophota bacterium]